MRDPFVTQTIRSMIFKRIHRQSSFVRKNSKLLNINRCFSQGVSSSLNFNPICKRNSF